jgi:hypothetical protein
MLLALLQAIARPAPIVILPRQPDPMLWQARRRRVSLPTARQARGVDRSRRNRRRARTALMLTYLNINLVGVSSIVRRKIKSR